MTSTASTSRSFCVRNCVSTGRSLEADAEAAVVVVTVRSSSPLSVAVFVLVLVFVVAEESDLEATMPEEGG